MIKIILNTLLTYKLKIVKFVNIYCYSKGNIKKKKLGIVKSKGTNLI